MPSCILSVERFLPPYRYPQTVVTGWVRDWLHENGGADAARLLSVYATAGVETRASGVELFEQLAGLCLGKNLTEATGWGNACAALSCRALDGMAMAPTRAEVEALLATRLG